MEKGTRKIGTACTKRIVISGPESTGKTTLSRNLARHFNCLWISEYAREYIENIETEYTYNDVELIAKKQVEQYHQFKEVNSSFIFFDTFLIITKIWFIDVYNKIPSWLDLVIKQCPVDLYLLCSPDLPWQSDPVRENPDRREYFFDLYKKEIENYGFNYKIIGGYGTIRQEHAVNEIIERFE